MKLLRNELTISLIIVLAFVGLDYYYKDNISHFVRQYINKIQPCEKPIQYSIGNIDPRFNLSKDDLIKVLGTAGNTWGKPLNKKLFEYSAAGDLKINFVYDYRQIATEDMAKIGVVINNDQSTYEILKAKYSSLKNSYLTEKTNNENLKAIYNTDKIAYEKDVVYWNSKGGAPRSEYTSLEQKRISLENQISMLNQSITTTNELAKTLNSAGEVLNKLIESLNLQVGKYNTTGSSVGKNFNQGEYISDSNGTEINIYQFNNADQLERVLAHEFGHALGLDHIKNPKAIMYYINEGSNQELTNDDLSALKKECNIQ